MDPGGEIRTLVELSSMEPMALTKTTSGGLLWLASSSRGGSQYRVETSDLDGGGRRLVCVGEGHRPTSAALGDDSRRLYWTDAKNMALWRLDLNEVEEEGGECRPELFRRFSRRPGAVAALRCGGGAAQDDHADCSCLNGGNCTTGGFCSCPPGFAGARCQDSVCDGFCLGGGLCSVGEDGRPACRCGDQLTGRRCEQIDVVMVG